MIFLSTNINFLTYMCVCMYVCGVQRDYQHYAIIIIDHSGTHYTVCTFELSARWRTSFFIFLFLPCVQSKV